MSWVTPLFSGLGSAAGIAGNVASLFGGGKGQSKSGPGFKGTIVTPSYTFGAGKLIRNNQDILNQQRGLSGQLGNLQAEVRPGYGRLTDAGVNAIRQKAASQVGNLRAQQAKRGLAGASFANNELNNLQMAYDQAENEFRTQAWQQELEASTQLIEQQNRLLQDQTARELSELGLSTSFLAAVNQGQRSKSLIKNALNQYNLVSSLAEQVGQPGATTQNIALPPDYQFAPGKALGGPINAGQPYMVGEHGPELIVPNANATVVPNNQLAGMGQPMGHLGGLVSQVLQKGAQELSSPILNVMSPPDRAISGLSNKMQGVGGNPPMTAQARARGLGGVAADLAKRGVIRGGMERGRSEAAGRNL